MLGVKYSDWKKLFSLFVLPTSSRTEHKNNKAKMQTVPPGTTAGLLWSSLYPVYTLKHAKILRKVRAMSLSLLNFQVLGAFNFIVPSEVVD